MAFDGTDFVDTGYGTSRPKPPDGRVPTSEELAQQVTSAQQQLLKLRETQEQIERTRAAVEEIRRQRSEFTQGRTEMLASLTRATGLLEKAEHDARQDAEQMAKSLEGLRLALSQVERLEEKAWTSETWQQELNRALVTLANARIEYNSARLKWPVLDGRTPGHATENAAPVHPPLTALTLPQLCRLGLALTWPIALVALLGLGTMLLMLLRS